MFGKRVFSWVKVQGALRTQGFVTATPPTRTVLLLPHHLPAYASQVFQVPVVIEVMLERVTNIPMGTEINNIVEFEDAPQPAKQEA